MKDDPFGFEKLDDLIEEWEKSVIELRSLRAGRPPGHGMLRGEVISRKDNVIKVRLKTVALV